MKVFKMLLKKDVEGGEDLGVFALSLVNSPGTKSNYIALSEEANGSKPKIIETYLSVVDEKKHILTGAVLIPDLPILRRDKETNKPYEIVFPSETVELASEQFMKSFNQKATTAEHLVKIEGCTVIETWLKSSEIDKSVALGIEAPVGTWFVSLKVDNLALWDGFIETGLLNGFSIEGNFIAVEMEETQEVELKENTKMVKGKSIITKIKELAGLSYKEVALESQVAEVNKWMLDVVNDTFELGEKVMRKPYSEDEDARPLGAGEWELEGGQKILTDSEGYIRYKFPIGVALSEQATEVEAEVKEPIATETVVDTKETVEAEAEVDNTVDKVLKDKSTPNAAPSDIDAKTEVKAPIVEDTPENTLDTVKEVVEKKEEENVQMIPHTDAKIEVKKKPLKFDHNMTTAERIKAQLEHNLN